MLDQVEESGVATSGGVWVAAGGCEQAARRDRNSGGRLRVRKGAVLKHLAEVWKDLVPLPRNHGGHGGKLI
jgi:hypothetical protein